MLATDRQGHCLPAVWLWVYVILTADWNAADRPDQGRYVPGGTARHWPWPSLAGQGHRERWRPPAATLRQCRDRGRRLLAGLPSSSASPDWLGSVTWLPVPTTGRFVRISIHNYLEISKISLNKPVVELARVLLSFKRPTRRHRTAIAVTYSTHNFQNPFQMLHLPDFDIRLVGSFDL